MWKSNHSYFENENCISSSISNGLFPSILEQSSWSENNSILGTCCQLGLCGCGVGRHIKPPEMISDNMTAALAMRFAWMVQPRNYIYYLHAMPQMSLCTTISTLAMGKGERVPLREGG